MLILKFRPKIVPGKTGTACSLGHAHSHSYFLTKTYDMGPQKNHLSEMVLLSFQNIGKNILLCLRGAMSPY